MLEPIQMSKVCSEHQIQLQRVCLHPDCTARAMCLLCEHQHDPGSHFRSIMTSQSLSYSVFASAIDTAIDCFLSGPTLNTLSNLKTRTKNHINNYFTELSNSLVRLLQDKRKALVQEVDDPKESADKIISLLRQTRASRSYLGASTSTFNLFKSIYDGAELAELLEDIDRRSVESIYEALRKLHQEVSKFALSQQFSLHVPLPTFYSQPMQLKEPTKQVREEESFFKPKAKGFVASLKSQSSAEFNSIISDSTRLHNNHLLVTSYDKTLRVFSPSLEQLAQFETENILTKIFPLPSDEMFVVAHSKELLIQKIAQRDGQWTNSPVMALKGHAERIHSLAALNSRIILSASTEGVKVWDLYKEKCEFTFRDERGKNNPSCINLIKESKTLGVGCHGASLQLQSLETLKCFKKYALDGVPLVITPVDGCFYVGGFPSQLSFYDPRERRPVWSIDFLSDAVSCMSEINQGLLAVGFRDGTCREVDIKKRLVLADWSPHESRGSWSKPNGVVSIYARAQREYLSVGCSDHLLRVFGVSETS